MAAGLVILPSHRNLKGLPIPRQLHQEVVKEIRFFNDAFTRPQDLIPKHTFDAPRQPVVAQRLRFRDALRNSAALAAEYAELKLQLTHQFPLDREVYTNGKTAFIQRVLAQV